jgi:hypothetical protein
MANACQWCEPLTIEERIERLERRDRGTSWILLALIISVTCLSLKAQLDG